MSGLCDATVKRPHLGATTRMKWLDEQLGLTQRDFLQFLSFKFASISVNAPLRRRRLNLSVYPSRGERRQFRDGVRYHTGLLGSAFLKEEPFQHKADIAREDWGGGREWFQTLS